MSTQAGSLPVLKLLPSWQSELPGVKDHSGDPVLSGHLEADCSLSAGTQHQLVLLRGWPRPWDSVSFSLPLPLIDPKKPLGGWKQGPFLRVPGGPQALVPLPELLTAPAQTVFSTLAAHVALWPPSLSQIGTLSLALPVGPRVSGNLKSEKDAFVCFLHLYFCPVPD